MNAGFFGKTATRLAMGFASLIALTLVLVVTSTLGIGRIERAIETIYNDRTVPLQQLEIIQEAALQNRIHIMDMIFNPTQANIEKRIAAIKTDVAKADQATKDYMATYLTPEEKELARGLTEARTKYRDEALLPSIAALQARNHNEAKRLYTEKIAAFSADIDKYQEALVDLQVREAKSDFNAASQTQQTMHWIMFAIAATSILLGVFVALFITRKLTRQLGAEPHELAAIANHIASGNLALVDTHVAPPGSVLASMQTMQQSLTQLVADVRYSVDSVSTASAQIAAGNQDLSSRTEQQASSLQQTAASMEQLTSTVKQSADNARQANQLATSASEVAVRGGRVVGQVVDTMEAINGSSKKISDIITVIDGIAFQTNILALNAAVEAARAGEQGRGFAVVAGEVRNLAQRSAQAAREIKSLIHDSVEKVENGTKQVAEAGQTMDEIVNQVKRVTDLIGEISSAAMEQSSGIAQVNTAVTQMDQTTQQNAALVEQSAAAAASLNDQAKRLADAVAAFKLSESETRRAIANADASARKTIAANSTGTRQVASVVPASSAKPGKAAVDTGDWEEF